MKKYNILWMKLFIELANDFYDKDVYNCTYYQAVNSNIAKLNEKYISWFINYQV